MWSPLALRPPRSLAPAATSSGHQSERFGGTWTPTSGSSRRASATSRFICASVTGAGPGRARPARAAAEPVRQYSRAAAPAISRGLTAVVALVRHEILEDDLLDVAVLGVHRGELLERLHALLLALPDPDEDPARERDPQLAGGADRLQPPRRVLGRRALVRDQSALDRLEHQSLRGGHLPQPREVDARRARRGWCAAVGRARAPARTPTRRSRRSPRSRARQLLPDPALTSGCSPVRTSSSLTRWRATAPSSIASTSSGS